MWLYLAMMGAAWGAGGMVWRLLRIPLRAAHNPDGTPGWWRIVMAGCLPLLRWGAPFWRYLGQARLAGLIAQAGLPTAVRAEHVLALGLLAGLAGAGLAGVGMLAGEAWNGAHGGPFGAVDSSRRLPWAMAGGALASVLPVLWLRARGAARRRRIERGLPFVLDMMILCVEAGLSVPAALLVAASNGPDGPLRESLAVALAQMRAGVSRAVALRAMAERCGSALVGDWVAALAQADALGISLAPVLRAQAVQCRRDRQPRAEQLALQAPVKLLLPLVGCIFPCTFIVLAFPIAIQLLRGSA